MLLRYRNVFFQPKVVNGHLFERRKQVSESSVTSVIDTQNQIIQISDQKHAPRKKSRKNLIIVFSLIFLREYVTGKWLLVIYLIIRLLAYGIFGVFAYYLNTVYCVVSVYKLRINFHIITLAYLYQGFITVHNFRRLEEFYLLIFTQYTGKKLIFLRKETFRCIDYSFVNMR